MGRWDGNIQGVLLASAARTATESSADQKNYGGRGVIVTVDVTAASATPSVVLTIEAKDPASLAYEPLLTTSAITGISRNTYIVYPGIAAAAEAVTAVSGFVLPKTWRGTMTHADADSITYSIGYSVIG